MFKHECPHPYHKEVKRSLIEKVTPLFVVALILFAFVLGRFSVGELYDLSIENDKLQEKNDELTASNQAFFKQQDFIESGKKVDKLAKNNARRVLTSLHDELSEVKEQLRFYQRIISPESLIKGLYIHSFNVTKQIDGKRFDYHLTLAQVSNKRVAIKGKATFIIEGQQKGKPVALVMKSITLDQKESIAFSFRYYQLLSGAMMLPEGFVPERVVVKLKPTSKSQKPLQKMWQWTDVVEVAAVQ